jgi:hypothetical protein
MSSLRFPHRIDRRALLGSGLAALASVIPADAQNAELSADKLESLIARAMADKETIAFSRPAILGFTESKLVAHQLAYEYQSTNYYFSVFVPRREDGIVFSKGQDKPLSFSMHRTGPHLKRMVSALNRGGNLVSWYGPEADADFAEQKAYWATRQ